MSVAVRYWLARHEARDDLKQQLDAWLHVMTAELGIDLQSRLAELPYVVDRGSQSVDVVFNGAAGSKLWRDWMVSFARFIDDNAPDLSREGIWDLVGDQPNPASVKGARREHP